MIGLGAARNVVISCRPTDMRKAWNGLAAMALEEFTEDASSGTVFLFVSRDRKLAKLIWWDGHGFCLFQKRIPRGRFAAPWQHVYEGRVVLSLTQVALFFEGSPFAFSGSLLPLKTAAERIATNISPVR